MSNDHPFQHLFETFGKLPRAHAESVNREAREKMKGWLNVPLGDAGHCILLRAPRAGHGKTHLLTRLQYELGGSHEFVPLHAVGGSRIDATTVLDNTLRRLLRSLPAAGGLTVLDLVARRLFSASLQPLVNSGEVPCQDREGAINALRSRPVETFDFHHPGAVTAHWARDNFELLCPRLSLELAKNNGLALREVTFWVEAMFRFSTTPLDNPGRANALTSAVFDGSNAETVYHERLVALLGLLTSLMRVVLVADEIEGFSSDEAAALRFASFIGSLRQSAERVDIILSVNSDVWESAFVPRLSGGLSDRLSEVVVELDALDEAGMIAILESRSPGNGEQLYRKMQDAPTYARGLLKAAGEVDGREETPEATAMRVPEAKPVEHGVEKQDSSTTERTVGSIFEKAPEVTPEATPEPPVYSENTPTATPSADFAIEADPGFDPESGFCTPPDTPEKPRDSAGAAVIASQPFFSNHPTAEEAHGIEQTPVEQPSSWPSPEVSEFSAAPAQVTEIEPKEQESMPESQPSPIEKEAPQASFAEAASPSEEMHSAEQAPGFAFQAAPIQTENDNAPFQATPFPEPEARPQPSAFQAVPPVTAPEKQSPQDAGPDPDPSTDRVDDLLRQFRQRYGKG